MVKKWTYRGDKVCLEYNDGENVFVHRSDFNRAFGAIVNASKEDVIRDFAIENKKSTIREMSVDERTELELQILETLKLSVSSEYAMKILLTEEEPTESTLLGDIVLDIQETSAWNDEGIYTEDDIRLSIGRLILYRLGGIV